MNLKNCFFLFMSAITLIIGVLLLCAHYRGPSFIDKKIIEKLKLKENSEAIRYWKNPPASIYRKFYMFNVTNSKEVLKGKIPKLKECGPYVYREEMDKINMTHLDLNRVQYTSVSTLYFEPNMSNGSQDDVINFLNLLELGASAKSKLFTIRNVFISKKIDELIAGHTSNALKMINQIKGKSIEKYGLYSEKNGTGLNTFVAYTGHDNIYDLGKLESWNGKKELNQWTTNSTRAIHGSDGSKYPPKIQTNQTLYFFNPDLCRSMRLEYLRDNCIGGVRTYDFHLPTNIFSNNETLNPEYEGFCPKKDCYDGLQSIRECKDGLPMFVSLPHFLNADTKLIANVSGLNPDKEKHDYTLSIEPLSGTTIQSKIRIQFNYLLHKKAIPLPEKSKFKEVMLPLFWIELDIDTNPEVKSKLSFPIFLIMIFKSLYVLCSGCGFLILSCVFFFINFTLKFFLRNKLEPSFTLEKNKNRRFIA